MKKAVILLSGGLDSTTCLAIAKAAGYACYALSVRYGQRLVAELAAAKQVAADYAAVEHRIANVDLHLWGGSALTDPTLAVPHERSSDIPVTYVPARNTIFLSMALAWAEVLGAQDIFIGANAVDYSNYPDCRPDYLNAYQAMANLATRAGREGRPLQIHAPLLHLSKAEIVQKGVSLGVDYSVTVTCYEADASGLACGLCDACHFRAKGFQDAGIADPTRYRDAES